jgi:radical SAM superfamily enzyme YgiQ (UPF0313 family)
MQNGFPVVLTADRTLMAGYSTLLDGMLVGSMTTLVPSFAIRLLAPRVASDGMRAVQAPLGLRRVEAALLAGGWTADEVVVAAPEDLCRVVGAETRIIGLSSGDPLGMGMNTTTMAGILGGEAHVTRWFRRLNRRIQQLRKGAHKAKVLFGGPGAWQLAANDRARQNLGIDHVVAGYCECSVSALFRDIASGKEPDAFRHPSPGSANFTFQDLTPPSSTETGSDLEMGIPAGGAQTEAALRAIPRVRGATVMGTVEISRGCGMGCAFCAMARERMFHLPVEGILADVETNLRAGVTNVGLVTEDMFRYGAVGAKVSPSALMGVLRRLRELPEVRLIQSDHANISSIAQYSDEELSEAFRLLSGKGGPHASAFVWLNLGVETASGELLAANGGRPKIHPWDPADWGEATLKHTRRLIRAGFLPLVSLVMGLPGESPVDVEKTLRWVEALRGERCTVFPMLYAPLDSGPAFTLAHMTARHWRLMRECYRFNYRWIPPLYWDNQTAAGVSLPRRLMVQGLGRGQKPLLKTVFFVRSLRARDGKAAHTCAVPKK